MTDVQTFFYAAPGESGLRQLGPMVVSPGGLIISEFGGGPAGSSGLAIG